MRMEPLNPVLSAHDLVEKLLTSHITQQIYVFLDALMPLGYGYKMTTYGGSYQGYFGRIENGDILNTWIANSGTSEAEAVASLLKLVFSGNIRPLACTSEGYRSLLVALRQSGEAYVEAEGRVADGLDQIAALHAIPERLEAQLQATEEAYREMATNYGGPEYAESLLEQVRGASFERVGITACSACGNDHPNLLVVMGKGGEKYAICPVSRIKIYIHDSGDNSTEMPF